MTTLTSLRSERSGTATEIEQETSKHGDKKKGHTRRGEGRGSESSADNPDQSAVREARHHKARVRGKANNTVWSNGRANEQKGGEMFKYHTNRFRYW